MTTKTIKIVYCLDEDGRRASLLAGGDGREIQVAEVPATPELLQRSWVREDGSAWIHLSTVEGAEVVTRVPKRTVTVKRWTTVYSGPRLVACRIDEYAKPLATPLEDPVAYVLAEDAREAESKRQAEEKVAAWEAKRKTEERERREKAAPIVARYLAGDESVTLSRTAQLLPDRLYPTGGGATLASLDASDEWTDGLIKEWDRRTKIEAERAAAKKAKEGLAKQAAAQAMETWAREHGSPRLRKCTEAGMLDKCGRIYLEERLAHEMPDWEWWKGDYEESEIINPSEAHLDALLEARKAFGEEVVLSRVDVGAHEPDDEDGEQRKVWWTALSVPVAWNPDKWAVRFLEDAE